MQEDQRKDLLEKWQILGLSFMMMSKTPEDFHDLVKQEFGYIWDGTNQRFKRLGCLPKAHLPQGKRLKKPLHGTAIDPLNAKTQ